MSDVEAAVVNAEQTARLDAHADRITRLEDAMSTVLENQATMTANLSNLTALMSGVADMLKKGGIGVLLLVAAGLGVDASGVLTTGV